MNPLALVKERFGVALAKLGAKDLDLLLEMVTQAQDPRFGDYQANCAMPLGKQLRRPPREIAQQLIDLVDLGELCEPPEVAGPGFINLRLRDDWLAQQTEKIRQDERLGVALTRRPRTYVVDYSSPNVAKPMHVGHIRSTVIGDALCRSLRFLGHDVISDNHLGDWGTQFGMIIYGYRHFVDQQAYQANPVAELGRIYREVRMLIDFHEGQLALPQLRARLTGLRQKLEAVSVEQKAADPQSAKKAAKQLSKIEDEIRNQSEAIQSLERKLAAVTDDAEAAARAQRHADVGKAVLGETAKLHAGDEDNRKLWEQFLPKCRQEIDRIYKRLDVTFDEELGESFYHGRLASVVQQLQAKGLAKESEGAICVFLAGYDAPMIVRKKDGAYLYATTDLATIEYRMERWNPDEILYVVDFRQGDHFGKLFAAANAWGFDVELKHVSFGTVLGRDKKPIKTRSGDTTPLEGLLDQAVARAHAVVSANDDRKPTPELSAQQRDRIASVIGHAAIKYADLSQNRTSDYVFDEDKMVAMQGNTATYLQYSYARTQNIFAKGSVDIAALRQSSAAIMLTGDTERGLALKLLQFEEALDEMLVDYRPNLLTNYLYQLAKRFAEFFEVCPVLKAESDSLKDSRLLLCDLVGRTMKLGLSLLGIQVVDKM